MSLGNNPVSVLAYVKAQSTLLFIWSLTDCPLPMSLLSTVSPSGQLETLLRTPSFPPGHYPFMPPATPYGSVFRQPGSPGYTDVFDSQQHCPDPRACPNPHSAPDEFDRDLWIQEALTDLSKTPGWEEALAFFEVYVHTPSGENTLYREGVCTLMLGDKTFPFIPHNA